MSGDLPKSIDELPVGSPRWVCQPMKRVEDPMLLTGQAEFIDNMSLPGMLHCAILRSPPSPPAPGGGGTSGLAVNRARFGGVPVASVAAAGRYLAEDALELITVEYE